MKFHLERNERQNAITGYGPDYVLIKGIRYGASLAVLPDALLEAWGRAGFSGLSESDFEALRDLNPEIVLVGTGPTLRFPSPRVLRPLIEARIGYEIMDFGAACRTYNVLMGEGRRVVAALLFD